MADVGYYTLPVIASFDGIDAQVNKTLGSKFGTAGRKAGKDFSKGMGDGLKNLQAEVKLAGDAYGKMKDKAEDSLGKVRVAEAALVKVRASGDTARVVAAEERLATARRNNIRVTKDAGDALRVFTGAQKSLADGNDDLGSKFGKLDSLAAGAGKAIAAAGVVAAGAAVVGVAALAAGVLAAGNALYELGAQFDDTFDNIRIKTGATGPALQQLEDATDRLATKVPASIGEIGNVVAETSRALHLTGPELESVAKNIAELGRLSGENVDIRALGKAFRGFGVDAQDQVPALNSLFRASQKTGVGVNELLATIVKGGAGLRQFGFDFGESAALATQFEEAGLDTTKALAGLTKGLATMAKDGKTGEDALRGAVTQIKDLLKAGDDAAALDMTNKLFGARSGVQFFEAIKNGALDLDTLADSVSNTGDTIAQAATDTNDWTERWQLLKNQLAVELKPIATGLFDGVNAELEKAADGIVENKDVIIDALVTIGDTFLATSEVSIRSLGLWSEGLGQMVAPLGDVLGGLTDFNAIVQRTLGRDDIADQLEADAQGYYSMGEGMTAFGRSVKDTNFDALRESLHNIGEQAKHGDDNIMHLGTSLAALPAGKDIKVNVDTTSAEVKMQSLLQEWTKQITLPVTAAPSTPPGYNPLTGPLGGGRASGGPIFGPGGPTADRVPIMASAGEHMWTASEVNKVGGQANMYRLRALARKGALRGFAGGGDYAAGKLIFDPSKLGKQDPNAKSSNAGVNASPGRNPNQIGIPDWGQPGTSWGAPPDGWWSKPVNPDDILFPENRPPGHEWWGEHPYDKRIRALGFAGGGEITSDWYSSVAGSPYNMGGFGGSFDCSGAVSGGVNVAMGRKWNQGPPGGSARMATGSEAEWLTSQGFVTGVGPPGTIRVGWVNGGPGGGHTAMTLADGTNFESSSGKGVALGGNARGASDPMFTQHAYLPAGPQLPGANGSPASSSPSSSSSSSSKSSSGGGGSTQSLSDIASGAVKIGIDGLFETIGADGSFLPENLGIPKTLMAALGLKFNTAAGSFSLAGGFQPAKNGQPGDLSGGTSFSPFGMQTTMPQVGSPASGNGLGPAPGPAVDQSITINNPQGEPTEKSIERANRNRPRLNTHMPVGS